jgi:hypothetical protein
VSNVFPLLAAPPQSCALKTLRLYHAVPANEVNDQNGVLLTPVGICWPKENFRNY